MLVMHANEREREKERDTKRSVEIAIDGSDNFILDEHARLHVKREGERDDEY